jgi:EAL domain-containing protein (putative c-di-GMP-specific phosphodiesterase class I)
VARPQADGFVVLVTELSPTAALAARQAEAVAEKLRGTAGVPFSTAAGRFHGSASIGISLIDADCASAEEAHRQACIALHEARRAGHGGLRFFDPQAQQAVQDRLALEADLRHAIAHGELALHLQPQVQADGRLFGAEALLRWDHPSRGRVPPDRFIPLAEEGGLIVELGRWVLREGCRILRAWADDARCAALDLSINVSGREFAQPDFVAQVQAALRQAEAPPQRLMIELTESAVLADADDAARKMADLRRLGVRIALDDFGTGHSSLAYLTRLPLDQLKIDRSFVMRMLTNRNDAILVQTIIRLAEGLGLQVIAEGVETQTHVSSLLAMGCDSFQGYHFGRPMPAAQFVAAWPGSEGQQAPPTAA